MPSYTKQQLEERYQKLPEPLKEALFDGERAEKVFDIGKKYGLNVERIGFLAEEIGYFILGLTTPQSFISTLERRLGTTQDASQKLASDINHQILYPLRESLKKAHDIDVTEEKIQKGPSQTMPIKKEGGVHAGSIVNLSQKKFSQPEPPQPIHKEPSSQTPQEPPRQETKKYGGFDPYREPIEKHEEHDERELKTPLPSKIFKENLRGQAPSPPKPAIAPPPPNISIKPSSTPRLPGSKLPETISKIPSPSQIFKGTMEGQAPQSSSEASVPRQKIPPIDLRSLRSEQKIQTTNQRLETKREDVELKKIDPSALPQAIQKNFPSLNISQNSSTQPHQKEVAQPPPQRPVPEASRTPFKAQRSTQTMITQQASPPPSPSQISKGTLGGQAQSQSSKELSHMVRTMKDDVDQILKKPSSTNELPKHDPYHENTQHLTK